MVKLVFTLRRRKDMSREEFQRYWREQHAPLVARHAQALRIRRYIQVHARDTDLDTAISASRGSETRATPPHPPLPASGGGETRAYDGVAELWWESVEDLMAAYASEEGQVAGAELLEDERRFIDLHSSPLWIGEENVVIGP